MGKRCTWINIVAYFLTNNFTNPINFNAGSFLKISLVDLELKSSYYSPLDLQERQLQLGEDFSV